jgi:hypothetical protein
MAAMTYDGICFVCMYGVCRLVRTALMVHGYGKAYRALSLSWLVVVMYVQYHSPKRNKKKHDLNLFALCVHDEWYVDETCAESCLSLSYLLKAISYL